MELTDNQLILMALNNYKETLKRGIHFGNEVFEWAEMYEMIDKINKLIKNMEATSEYN